MVESSRTGDFEDGSEGGYVAIPIFPFVNFVLRHRWVIVLSGLFLALAGGTFAILRPVQYTSNGSFLPQGVGGSAGSAGISGVAAQLGIRVGGGDRGESPEFYADLLTTRKILAEIVNTSFTIRLPSGSRTTPLWKLLAPEETDSVAAIASAVEALREATVVSTDQSTGVVRVRITSNRRDLPAPIVDRLLELANEFDLERRQSRARAEGEFIEERLSELRGSLLEAENALQRFLQQNRNFEGSPELAFEHDRLRRIVLMRQDIVTSLAQSLEQARIEQVRNTPVLTVIEDPVTPVKADPRRLRLAIIASAILGIASGMMIAALRDLRVRERTGATSDFSEYQRLRREAVSDLKRPFRWMRARL